MRVIFAGTPGFAVPALRALVHAGHAGHTVALVLTQPDRPAGRGMAAQPGSVKRAAMELGLPIYQPAGLKDAASQARLATAAPDLLIVAAYGLILPQAVLDIPRFGALNIHGSLLPRWRGAAPIQRAIEAGDPRTGVGIMQMEAGLDTGPVLLEASTPIEPADTTGTLHDRLADLGAQVLMQVLADFDRYRRAARPQVATGMTYAAKITKAEAALDWRRPGDALARKVRAFNPAPGAVARLAGVDLKIWDAAAIVSTHNGPVGQVLTVTESGVDVACGTDALRLASLQRAGGKRLTVREYLRGSPIEVGARFDLPPE